MSGSDPKRSWDVEPDWCGCDWETCWQCGGDGWFDMHEQSPVEYGPGEVERCNECSGRGGFPHSADCPEVTDAA